MLASKPKILICDDSATIRKIIKTYLSKFDIKDIDEAEDGIIALEMLKSKTYDLVFVDFNMPNLNGLELATRFKATHTSDTTRLIVISSSLSRDLILKFKNIGVKNFIVKPFSQELFESTVTAILKFGLTPSQPTNEPNILEIDELFSNETPKITYDGKFVLCEFSKKTVAIDTEVFVKASRVYDN